MQDISSKNDVDPSTVDEVYTDTSMFNAEDIVKNIEEVAKQKQQQQQKQVAKANGNAKIDAKRRLEIMREQKRLAEDLQDIDDFDFAD